MEIKQPGVTVTESLISPEPDDVFIGIPVFIGYTPSPVDKIAIKLNSLADFARSFPESGLMYYSVRHFFENGGQQAYVLSLGTEQQLSDFSSLITALQQTWITQAISAENDITLIITPDAIRFNQTEVSYIQRDLWLQFWQSVLNLCKSRRGIMGLLDAPDNPTLAAECLKQFASADQQWGAVYWPRLKSAYQDQAQNPIVLSPTAAVAAVIQNNDNQQGVWTAPANVALAKVISPVHSYIEANALFNPSGTSLNLVRSFPGKGIKIWGCRTLENTPGSPWRYIQIRRLVSYIEAHMTQLGRAFIFEPNNAITWMKLKGQAYNWLRQLWLNGGLRGTQEDQAFELLLGVGESMSETDIQAGKMIMKISLAVLIPAEFIELSLTFDTRTGTTR
ncbi:phage tail sheath family protein [Photorhabdus laumondii subsp. laumondii]|uniref:Photorhabdus luminescens subsp. laumondii TTO1 complete genome segment 6/17 n=2 Tax=Photorhabdus laumondii subsp. laumondii TaxID=141679 RepID=Q7N679_PHOLL|nr:MULTISPECIES: phage tail sheath C-terminal domain-containing protein [Photorhabdus]AWK41528.1 phage tail protein [Photorhabdus laumondii subsp. laumondii]AXG42328.1 phage tail sheath family protein [Photorhabdus laumondii subsp. laumondii]AXG46851.1 phage tail sheath family protein [Photorhabdus laumondii subsp. laumondii]KTL61417.1 phage tail protein [Photorhabdus laumondii subsp. laumondii]MCC8382152.1 phage tail sheath family protein [Photorhabdus laumondii]